MASPREITTSWDAETVVLSYVIAVTGSYCTIQIMEQWRIQASAKRKRVLLLLASVALGGCGIWAMHFTGMHALHAHLPDGTQVRDADFDLSTTIVSLLFPIAGVFIGLTIASRDPFFLEIEHSNRKAMVAAEIKTMSLTQMLKKGAVQRRIKAVALFSRLWRILLGGLSAALGVLGMHYLGMMAQRSVLSMHFDDAYVAASCVIAFVTATAAFWIIFRALTFWPSIDALRIGSAMVMGVAVCGTHYAGMAATRYSLEPMDHVANDSGFVVDRALAFRIATNGSLVLCFWLVSLTVVRDLRVSAESTRSPSHPSSSHNKNNSVRPSDENAVLPLYSSSRYRSINAQRVNSRTTSSGVVANSTVVAKLQHKQLVIPSTPPSGRDDLEPVVPGAL